MQEAYRIQVAASKDDLEKGKNLLWDSGFVDSDTSLFITYNGSHCNRQRSIFGVFG